MGTMVKPTTGECPMVGATTFNLNSVERRGMFAHQFREERKKPARRPEAEVARGVLRMVAGLRCDYGCRSKGCRMGKRNSSVGGGKPEAELTAMGVRGEAVHGSKSGWGCRNGGGRSAPVHCDEFAMC